MKKSFLLALALIGAAFVPGSASAGVATAGAVLLDPFDPVPEISFRHYGGYAYGYGGCHVGCGYTGCDDGCYRPRYHHRHYRRCDDDCDRDYDRDRDDRPPPAPPCTSARCYDAEHYERRWRDGDRVGVEWFDRGHKERTVGDHDHDDRFYGRGDGDWRNDDDRGPPPGPPAGH
ncbi:MAG: hypothetical protein JSR60_00755 [Proteobacteria bacterium]|nr:hypothetical protein [Pseudomonadota bacterium]